MKKNDFFPKSWDVYLSDGDIYCFCFWQPTYISDKENCSLAQKPSDICFHKKGEQQLNEITFWIITKRSPRKAFNFDKYWRLVIPRTSCHLNIQEKEIFKERTSVSYFLLLISRRILKYKRGCFSFTLFDRSLVPIFWQQSPDWI